MGDELLRRLRRVFIVACGTSYHAGLVAAYAIEQLARVPVQIDVASEFRYRDPVLDADTLVIGITQSGETADTLAAMRLARQAGSPVLALTNIMGSQATRDADAVLFTRAGLEIGVAATKTHVAQVAALLLLTLRHGPRPRHHDRRRAAAARPRAARRCPASCGSTSTASAGIEEIARRYHDERFFLYLGRDMGFAVCLEGALKLKEISYIPTEAYAAGEMKHGPIALLDARLAGRGGRQRQPRVPQAGLATSRRCAPAAPTSSPLPARATRRSTSWPPRCCWVPRCDPLLAPLLTVVPLQLARLPHRAAEGPQRRPAAQPGQDGDGGVTELRRLGEATAAWHRRRGGGARLRALLDPAAGGLRAPLQRAGAQLLRGFADPYPRYAARFAAKEAVGKALGIGIIGFRWRDIEVLSGGKPLAALHGGVAEIARAPRRVARRALAESHRRSMAYAVAAAVKEGDDG